MERKFHVSHKKSLSRVRSARRRPGCIRLFVCPTTGGRMEISVSPRETVFGLKAALARKLRVSPSKISLIYKDKVLRDGCIQDHNILDDSQVTLLPNMESGLSINRSDRSIIQALENLTETQVNDFLSGRSPLMLAIRMGENMVFVQLQLSMLHPAPQRGTVNPGGNSSASASSGTTPSAGMGAAAGSRFGQQHQEQRSHQPPPAVTFNSTSAFAEATRCLSQRLNRLHELNCNGQRASRTAPSSYGRLQPPTQTPAGLDTPPTSPAPPTSSPSSVSSQQARHHAHQGPTAFPLPPPPVTTEAPHGTGSTTALSSLPLGAAAPLSPPPSPGAIIDTMRSLGRGIYSGTFQGTLDPSLQDGQGRPRRSVNTILHILNDLLVAAPSQTQPQPQVQQTAAPPTGSKSVRPTQKHTAVLTPPPSPTARGSPAVQSKPRPSTPASTNQSYISPVTFAAPISAPASEVEENSDNALLRGKMQRVQMMLAQRKEQRRTRREMAGPYYTPTSSAGSNISLGNRHASVPMRTTVGSSTKSVAKSIIRSSLTTKASAHSSTMCVTAPVPSSTSSTSSTLSAAMDDSSCMEELQHQQNQQQQKQAPGTSCRNGGEPPCQTCAYCNPSREQDSLAV
ncbi:hypothetical protein RRG08_018091 [Elysia crispata]|uniref:Ubiquitin-like domain-containing protein n=1 Tax=Elysia crispata TaxID=231223 RepID=A0AAE1DE49_9GAST|nr:hypothetical protein RRG08_018091 [Elysia crispata]